MVKGNITSKEFEVAVDKIGYVIEINKKAEVQG